MEKKVLSIGQICSRFSSGKNITAVNIKAVGEYPVYGGNGLRGYTSTYNFDGECSIVGRQGAYCGNVKYVVGKSYMSEHAIVAVTRPEHNNKYFSYKLALANLGRFSGQAAQPGLSVTKLLRLKFEMPSKSYQDKIASILSTYDTLIENNTKRIRLLEQMAENLYKEWFVRFRFPGHENAEMENGLPKGWKVEKLFEVADVGYGYAFKSDKFCAGNNQNAVVRIRDIQDNHTDTYTDEVCDKKYLIKRNAILVGMDGIFHMCLWNGERAYLNQRVVMLNSKMSDVCNYLLYFSIRPQIKYWEQVIAGTTVAHLGDKHLRRVKVLVPDQDILRKANKILEEAMNEINNLQRQNKYLTRQRDLLLPRLMSGKLEVKA